MWPMRSGPHFSHPHKPTNRSHYGADRQTPKFRWDEFDGGAIFLLRFDHGFADVILGRITEFGQSRLDRGVFARHVRPKGQQSAFNPFD